MAWSRSVREPLLITEYVLLEVVNALANTPMRDATHLLTTMVLAEHEGYRFLPVDITLLRSGLNFFARRSDKHWSLTDCVSFHVMEQRGLTRALAHDHHFEQAGFDPLLRREP